MASLGYVDIRSVTEWGRINGVPDLGRLWRMVFALDLAFVNHMSEEAKRDRDQRRNQR